LPLKNSRPELGICKAIGDTGQSGLLKKNKEKYLLLMAAEKQSHGEIMGSVSFQRAARKAYS
jgi:hypothetical protein